MKKLFLLACCLVCALSSNAQGHPSSRFEGIAGPPVCGQFEKYELIIDEITDLPEHSEFPTKPKGYYYYDPLRISLYANFYSPSNKVYQVYGFYYEDYGFSFANECSHLQGVPQIGHTAHENPSIDSKQAVSSDWRFRFSPNELGVWRVEAFAQLSYVGSNFPGAPNVILQAPAQFFECTPGPLSDRGFITIGPNQRTIKRDGSVLPLLGEHIENDLRIQVPNSNNDNNLSSASAPFVGGVCMYKGLIDELTAAGGNYFRMGFNTALSQRDKTPQDNNASRENEIKRMGNLIYYDMNYCYNLGFDIKNAYRYDRVLDYASENNVFIRPVLFSAGFFTEDGWQCWEPPNTNANFLPTNPYYFSYPGASPGDIFSITHSHHEKTRNYLRYVIARWGYASNIVAWELMDEFDMVVIDRVNKTTSISVGGAQNDVFKWMKENSNLIKVQDFNRHLVTTGGTALDYPEKFNKSNTLLTRFLSLFSPTFNYNVFDYIYNLESIDFVDNNREPTPDGIPMYDINHRWDYANVCNPQNFDKNGTPDAFKINFKWFLKYSQDELKYWEKPFVYNSYWLSFASYTILCNNTPRKDGIETPEVLDNNNFILHDAFYSTLFGNSMIAGNYYYSSHLHPNHMKATGDVKCMPPNSWGMDYGNIGWYDGSMKSFTETKQALDVLFGNMDQKMIPRSSLFDLLPDKSFCVLKSSPGTIQNNILVAHLTNASKTLQKGWIKNLDYSMFTSFGTQCSYFTTLSNPPLSPALLLAAPRSGTGINYELILHTIGTTTTSVVIQEEPMVSGMNPGYAYFELPAFSNKYGDFVYEVHAVSDAVACSNNIDRTFAADIDGDGIDELIVVNTCLKNNVDFMQFYDLNNQNMEGSIGHDFDKYVDFTGPNDKIFFHDFILDRPGMEILLVNRDLGSSDGNFYVVVNPDNGNIVKYMSNSEILAHYNVNSISDITVGAGNFDIDAFTELALVLPYHKKISFIEIESKTFETEIPSINPVFLDNPNDRILFGKYQVSTEKDYVYLLNYNAAPNADAMAIFGLEEYRYGGTKQIATLTHGSTGGNFSGWMDYCDRALLGNVDNSNQSVIGDFNEIVFVNTDNSGATGQYMIRWQDIRNNRFGGPGSELVGPNMDKLDMNDEFFLADLDGGGVEYLVSVNRSYAPNSSGITTYNLNSTSFVYSLGVMPNYSMPSGTLGNAHDGWLDPSDDHLIIKNLRSAVVLPPSLPPPIWFPVFVNRPFDLSQFFARPYDLSAGTGNMVMATMHYNQCPSNVEKCVEGIVAKTCYNAIPGDQKIQPVNKPFDQSSQRPSDPADISNTATSNTTQVSDESNTSGNTVKVFPNPFSDQLNFEVQLAQTNPVTIHLYNNLGENVMSITQNCNSGPNIVSFNRVQLSPGVYYGTIYFGDSVTTVKVTLIK